MQEDTVDEILFETPVDFLEKAMDDDKPPRRMMKGVMSTEKEDHDGETIFQNGLDCTYLMKSGYVNYNHLRKLVAGVKMPVIIGYPTSLEKGHKCHILESELLQGNHQVSEQMRLAEEMWQLGLALQKSGSARRLAYSVEGPPPERRGKKIVKAWVHHVALTHCPVNDDSSLEMFQKSLCCGKCSPSHPQYNPAHQGCGNKGHHFDDGIPHLLAIMEKALASDNSGPVSVPRTSPLMKENLDRGLTTVLYGEQTCEHFSEHTGLFHKGISGAFDHMTGCLGYSIDDSKTLLARIIDGAKKDEEVLALTKAAGFISY
jgi:hypothetical protein